MKQEGIVTVEAIAEALWNNRIATVRIRGITWEKVASAKDGDSGMTQWIHLRNEVFDEARAVYALLNAEQE